MRLLSLSLERYGAFAKRRIELPQAPVCLVYGGNEAGKSTALAALSDLLYGFPHNTAYGFRYDVKDLRLGAEIESAAGDRLAFRRRKGRARTLLDAEDRSLPDQALAPFLGSSDRGLFEKAFGLSQVRLREAGAAMLRVGGDIGEMLIEAGSGISHLVEIQRALLQQAEDVYAERRSANRSFYQALGRYEHAQQRLRALILGADEWRRVVTDEERAAAALQALREGIARLQVEQQQLRRREIVLPILREIDDCLARLGELGVASALPADAEERWRKALDERARIGPEAEDADASIARLDGQIDALAVPEALLEQKEPIEDLYRKLGQIRGEQRDLPVRQTEARSERRRLEDLARRLGLADGEALAARQPSQVDLRRLEKLIREGAGIAREVERAGAAAAQAQAELTAVEAELDACGEAADPTDLLVRVERLAEAAALAEEAEASDRVRATLAEELARRAEALPLWTGEVSALAMAKLPQRRTLRRHADELRRLDDREVAIRQMIAAAREAAQEARRRLDELAAGGIVPTRDALQAVRSARERGWALVRRRHVEGLHLDPSELEAVAGESDLVATYEALVQSADELADRREAEAHRLTDNAAAQAAEADGKRRLAAALADLSALRLERRDAEQRWTAVWVPAGIVPTTPAEMEEWLDAVQDLLKQHAELTVLERDGAAIAARRDKARSELDGLAGMLGIDPQRHDPDSLTTALVHQVDARRAAWERRQALRSRHAERRRILEQAVAERGAAMRGLEKWQATWRSALAGLGLGPDLSPEEGETALDLWREVLSTRKGLSDLERRVDAMQASVQGFGAAAADLAGRVATDLAAMPAGEAMQELFRRVREAEKRAETVVGLRAQRTELCRRRAGLARRAKAAEDEIATLVALAEVADEAALGPALEKARLRREAEARRQAARDRLAEAAEGIPEKSLRQEVRDLDLATVRQRMLEIEDELMRLGDERDGAAAEHARAVAALQALQTRGSAEAAAQDAQAALAGLAQLATDWAAARAASLLLKHAIDRYREEHQSPLVARAGALFGALTGGAFARLVVDYDEKDEPLLAGERPDGERCPVHGLSDGTTDQLYLALRLATLEAYCDKAEPLPFVGDDILVHFDDARAAATLQVLADFDACQILLFTHHRHIVELAEATLPGRCAVVEL